MQHAAGFLGDLVFVHYSGIFLFYWALLYGQRCMRCVNDTTERYTLYEINWLTSLSTSIVIES